MKITTKTGDSGETSLMTRKVSKTSNIIKLIGKLDLIISTAGYCVGEDPEVDEELDNIQEMIKHVLNNLSHDKDIEEDVVKKLEKRMIPWENKIDELKGFVKPKGRSALLHILRAVIRESEIVAWESNYKNVAIFLNRLSDHIFLIAIYLSKKRSELVYFTS